MPFVRISLAKGQNSHFKQQISLAIHSALQMAFNIPEDDYFQVIEELEPSNLIFPAQYMGIPHNVDMIYIQITAKAGRTVAMKQQLYRSIAEQVEKRARHSCDNLVITLIETGDADWSFGRGIAQLVAQRDK